MTNVRQLHINVLAATTTMGVLLLFADSGSYLWFFGGLTYAWFFEYFYHRFIGHTNRLPIAAEKHRQHHREWRSEEAVSTDRTKPHLSEDWYFYPVALVTHFLVIKILFGVMPWEVLVAFTLFYLQFEIFHWATHIEDNCIDEFILEFPIVRGIRLRQIEWHIDHHDLPAENFNFTYPYPGDKVFHTGPESYGRKTWDFQ
jgi:hypothetical protein